MTATNASTIDAFAWTKAWAEETKLNVFSAESLESTNTTAKKDGTAADLYLARRQTAGRGRGQNSWESCDGALLSSWCFAVERVPQPIFSPLAGLALYEACAATWPLISFNLKAPNDLYIDKEKVAGLLIETIDSGTRKLTIVGLGFNVTSRPEKIENSTFLSDSLRSPLTVSTWRAFLSEWYTQIKLAVAGGQQDHLDPAKAERLRAALNLHPLLSEPILHVDELAQLHTPSGFTRWQEM
mgnify:CR=1 FL=1